MSDPQWLAWAKQLQAIAQTGLAYTGDPFDAERFAAVRRLASEIMAGGAGVPAEAIDGVFADEAGYATPKIDVRGVVFRDDAILLVKERADGLWTLPGGWADVGISPAENVAREVEEEAGFRTRAVKLLAVYDRNRHPHMPPHPFHIYKMFFRCEIVGGDAAAGTETSDVRFFAADRIPELSLDRVVPAQIARMFRHYRDPTLPTDFD